MNKPFEHDPNYEKKIHKQYMDHLKHMESYTQEPDLECIRICRSLPQRVWQLGDWCIYGDYPKYSKPAVITRILGTDERPELELTIPGKYTRYVACGIKRIWLPYPHQIMELECWPRDPHWYLINETDVDGNWAVGFEEDCPCNVECPGANTKIVSRASTARLACLRAIEPFLGGEEK